MNLATPVGLNWNEHSPGAAVTTTLFFAWAAARSGLAASVNMPNTGKYVSTPNKQPAMMIILRPILSDSAPNRTKNGVPMMSEIAIKTFAVALSTLSDPVMKNKA